VGIRPSAYPTVVSGRDKDRLATLPYGGITAWRPGTLEMHRIALHSTLNQTYLILEARVKLCVSSAMTEQVSCVFPRSVILCSVCPLQYTPNIDHKSINQMDFVIKRQCVHCEV
jgi:ferric-dicitrate binding protein FerR (iron transport regulator)